MSTTPSWLELAWQAWPGIWLMDFGRYLVTVGAFVVLLEALARYAPDWLQARGVRIREVRSRQQWHEFLRSCQTAVVFSITGTCVYLGAVFGALKVYAQPLEYGIAWLGICFVLMLILHDTWFYWTHRLLHHRRLFRSMHSAHHQSIAPTHWAAYSFSLPEAVVQSLFLPLFLWVIPAHPIIIFLWMTHMIVRNVMGHSGIELLPKTWLSGWWGRWLTTTLHHEMHHAWGQGNYALYFTWWDRLCNTEHPRYQDELQALLGKLRRQTDQQSLSPHIKMPVPALLAAALAATLFATEAAHAQDIRGEWATQGYSARVMIKPCASSPDQLCGTITWLWEPVDASGKPAKDAQNPDPARRELPLVGLDMLTGFKPSSERQQWSGGQIYNPEDGRTYNASLRLLSSELLEVKGCVMVFCARQVWRRLPLR
jgi:Delta7-sterol 5-desaturase